LESQTQILVLLAKSATSSGHTAIDCYQRMNYAYQGRHPPAKLAAMATAAPPDSTQSTTWISDTGATDHFTPDLHNIPDNQAYTDSQLVSVGNGNQLPISHIGNSQLRTSAYLFNLRKVLHVPSMKSIFFLSNVFAVIILLFLI
jgi:hypothetical protein